MRINMRNLYTFLFPLFFALSLSAQNRRTEFTYDHAGNRTARKVIEFTLVPPGAPAAPDEVAPLQEDLNTCRITVYPNPTKGVLTVSFSGGDAEALYKADLYDSAGRPVGSQSRNGNGDLSADLSEHPQGVYLLLVRTQSEERQFKIIKQ